MKYCPNCGQAVDEIQKFCHNCGNELTSDMPAEPYYTDDPRLRNDPTLTASPDFDAPAAQDEKVPELTLEPDLWGIPVQPAARPDPAPKEETVPELTLNPETRPDAQPKTDKVPELTLEPDLWGSSAAAAAAAPTPEAEPAAAPTYASVMEDIPYENDLKRQQAEREARLEAARKARAEREARMRAEAEARQTQQTYAPQQREQYDLPNDYTMSMDPNAAQEAEPDSTLYLAWGIVLTCLCSITGLVGMIQTIQARQEPNSVLRRRKLSSAKVWLIVGTALRVLPFLASIF